VKSDGWRVKRTRRGASGSRVCWNCGYDLGNGPGPRCPECGKTWVDPRAFSDPERHAARRSRWLATLLLIGVLLVCCTSPLWRSWLP